MRMKSTINNKNLPMLLLAAYPVLDYYYIGASNFTIACVLSLLVFVTTLFKGEFSFKRVPNSYYAYWLFCAVQIYLIAGIGGWSDYIPGGINLVLFSLCMFALASKFDAVLLHKYIKYVFMFTSALWFFQYGTWVFTHTKVIVFLPLTDSILTNHMTYAELCQWQSQVGGEMIERFSSIFSEPSHFAQYSLFLLVLELFLGENKNQLYTKFSVFIVLMLFLVQSGTGLMGLGFIALMKVLYILLITRKTKYYLFLAVMLPVFIVGINWYLGSSSGAYVSSRTEQLDYSDESSTSSGFVRMYFGWYRFGELTPVQKILGTSRNAVGEMREGGFFNGVTYTLCSQGLAGLTLLILFYIKCCRRQEPYPATMALLLLFISLIASTYLGGLMMIVTATVLGTYWLKPFKELNR